MSKKKVIIFGCQAIAIDILRHLHSLETVDVEMVITYEILSDISRGQESIIDVAEQLNIPISSPGRISNDLVQEIEKIQPDLIISAYYRKIFPKNLIKIPKLGIVNIHPSSLPDYRGPVPTAWAMLKGEKVFGVTIHQIDEGIDTGDILVQSLHDIDEEETGYDLYLKAMSIGSKLFIDNFENIINNKILPKKQRPGGSYFGKLDSKVFINWKDSAESIKNQVRVRSVPYNPIETILENKYFFINRVSIDDENKFPIQTPGKILKVYHDDRLLVSCSNGALIIEDYSVFPPFSGVEKEIYLKVGRHFDDL